jgi:uncharacterized protein with NAD-binding domain and iron-sulfur cluster
VAIVGGGCAGLAAAWELSRDPLTAAERHIMNVLFRRGRATAAEVAADLAHAAPADAKRGSKPRTPRNVAEELRALHAKGYIRPDERGARLFYLPAVSRSELPETYQITVYERSWRLGGKGASGRDAYGRIMEHGVHIWLGFYENAFRMMRECYETVQRKRWGPHRVERDSVLPFGRFDDAFFPEYHVGVASKQPGSDEPFVWSGHLPPMDGLPGTPLDDQTNPFSLQGYLIRAVEVGKALIHSILGTAAGAKPKAGSPPGRSTLDEALDLDFSFDPTESPSVLVERVAALLRAGVLTTAAGILQGVTILESMLKERNPAPQLSEGILKFIEALAAQTRKQLRDFVNIDMETRRKTEIIDLIMTIAVGVLRDRLLVHPRGLDAINHIDCKEWLRRHGAVKESVESPFVTGLYDLAFCYREGDRSQPALAAGQALRGALRMFFSYRGSVFWRMRAGMGETVFSPLYRVLKQRGVSFEFLHELESITLAGDKAERRVSMLRFRAPQRKDRLTDDAVLDHYGCWPHDAPAVHANELRELQDGRDFDAVVLAMGVDDFVKACGRPLSSDDRRWAEMADHVKTIATQAAQVWMTRSLSELGWRRGPVLVSAIDGPFETWADMTYTLASERAWRAHPESPSGGIAPRSEVKSVAYFCGVLPEKSLKRASADAGGDAEAARNAILEGVQARLGTMLSERMRSFWPTEEDPLDRLATRDGTGGGSLHDQHIQASFLGSDRFSLALPGSLDYRISPLERLVTNMTIAGDWTECGFNEGCIEAAVMSGMLAAHAISERPALDDIIGYNHP